MTPPPDVSVVVPAYRAEATLPACVESLLGQRTQRDFEIIVVASADTDDELPALPADPRLRVITAVPRLPAAVARNRGARAATGALIAFTDADVTAPPDWLERLTSAAAAADHDAVCVAGSILNGTPKSAVGTAEYLVEFFDLHPRRPAHTAWHGATCNLLVPRLLWDRYGPFPEDMEGGEDTVLTVRLRSAGQFAFAPDAAVVHHNRTRLGVVLRHQVHFGRFSARLARRTPVRMRFLTRYTLLAPVAAAGRIASLYARVLLWSPRSFPRALAVSPLVTAVVGAWGWGLAREGAALDARRVSGRRRRRGPAPDRA